MVVDDQALLERFAALCAEAVAVHGDDWPAVEAFVGRALAALAPNADVRQRLTRIARAGGEAPEGARRELPRLH